MANHKSSEKRIRQTATKREHNRYYAKTTRNAVKKLRMVTDRAVAVELLPKVVAMLDKLADYYDEEVEMEVQALMAAMEPIIIVVLAVVVGGLIAACMMPMMSMYEALDNM